MTFAQAERAALCDLFDAVGPDAPTLCEGWNAHQLAAHLWIRETDPVGVSGLVKPLAGLYDRRLAEVTQRWEFTELVERIRKGPARFSVFAIPGVDEGANTTEFFVHHEDVRRAAELPAGPRTLEADTEEWLWRRTKLLGRAWFRRAGVGVVLERAGSASSGGAGSGGAGSGGAGSGGAGSGGAGSGGAGSSGAGEGGAGEDREPESIRAVSGSPIVTVVGQPSEIMLYAHGRTAVAAVELVGEPEAVDILRSADLRV